MRADVVVNARILYKHYLVVQLWQTVFRSVNYATIRHQNYKDGGEYVMKLMMVLVADDDNDDLITTC